MELVEQWRIMVVFAGMEDSFTCPVFENLKVRYVVGVGAHEKNVAI